MFSIPLSFNKPKGVIMQVQIVKQRKVLDQFKFSKSTLFNQRKKGLMPPAVALGERAVAYLQHELDAVLSARIAGHTPEQLKALVKFLVAKRKEIL